jgi:RNA polymerase sigma factor (sigma-70 family)
VEQKTTDKGIDWERFQNGDETVFREFYDLYAEGLYGYGMKIARNEETVKECIQSLFVYIYEKRKSIARPNNLSAYVFASFRNRVVKTMAASAKDASLNDSVPDNYDFEITVDIQESLAKEDDELNKLKALQVALDKLSPQQREVVYLRFYKGLSIEQTAEVLGLASQTVSNVTHNAILKLRENDALSKAFLLSLLLILNKLIF